MLLRLLLIENHRCAAVDVSGVRCRGHSCCALARRSFWRQSMTPRPRDKDALMEGCMQAPLFHPRLQPASKDRSASQCSCVFRIFVSREVLQPAKGAHKASRRLSNACNNDTTTAPPPENPAFTKHLENACTIKDGGKPYRLGVTPSSLRGK